MYNHIRIHFVFNHSESLIAIYPMVFEKILRAAIFPKKTQLSQKPLNIYQSNFHR